MKYLKTYEEKRAMTFKEWIEFYSIDINTVYLDCGDSGLIDLEVHRT